MNRDQRGQATVLVLGMTMIVFGVVGVCTDGTKAFLFRRTLQSAADAAALAGASELDTSQYYSSRGRRIRLDPDAADRAAAGVLGLRGIPAHVSITTRGNQVIVRMRGEVPTLFLRVIGIETVPVAVEAASSPASVP